MKKQILRQNLVSEWQQLNPEMKLRYEQAIYRRMVANDLWKDAIVIGMTYAQIFEWNTVPLIESALKAGKTVALPKSDSKTHTMAFYSISDLDELTEGYAGILEPDPLVTVWVPQDRINLLVVPGIAFDTDGFRIGFGGGYYDRFLKSYQGAVVSLAAEFQLIEQVPREAFDLPVQYIFTEERLITTIV